MKFGGEIAKDASGNRQRFWAKMIGSRMTEEGMTHICDINDKELSEGKLLRGGKCNLKVCTKKWIEIWPVHGKWADGTGDYWGQRKKSR